MLPFAMVAPDPLCARNSKFLATATPEASSCCTNAVVATCVVEVVVAAVGAVSVPDTVAVASDRLAVPSLVVALVTEFGPAGPRAFDTVTVTLFSTGFPVTVTVCWVSS